MDLLYCNGRKSYDFSTDEGLYYPGWDPKYYHINDLGPKAFRRGYVAALFTENKRWQTLIEGFHMLVPGTRKSKRDAARDLAAKEFPQEQVAQTRIRIGSGFSKLGRKPLAVQMIVRTIATHAQTRGLSLNPPRLSG